MGMNRGANPESTELDPSKLTVLHSRSVADLPRIQSDLLGTDFRLADLFLRFVRETSMTRDDRNQLRTLILEYTFEAFPQASHLVLVLRDPVDSKLRPWIAEARDGSESEVTISSTLVERVMDEGVSLVFSHGESTKSNSKSIVASRIQTALCAPLSSVEDTFGIIQLDIR